MFVKQDFMVGYRHVDMDYRLTDRAILGYFEDAAGKHSSGVGYGVLDIPKTHLAWFLISVKLKVYKRPMYGETVTAITWSKGANRVFAFRDYELRNAEGELVAAGASVWVPIDRRTGAMMRLTSEIMEAFGTEDKSALKTGGKLREPKSYSATGEQKITASMIDFNEHVHNTYYIDFLNEILPESLRGAEINDLEIFYKNQILIGETVKLFYGEENGSHYVSIKTEDEKELHAIIKFEIA